MGVDNMVVTARHPIDRFYNWLLFEDLFPNEGFMPMAHVGMIPHRVLACDLVDTKRKWLEVDHPWYPLFFGMHHPDIDLAPAAAVGSGFDRGSDEKTVKSVARR
jgi:hypothetical protein